MLRRPLAASVLLGLALFGATLAVCDPFYTNDGAVMTMIASGTGIAQAPDEHLVFTNVLVGHALKALYGRAPDVPWYGLHLLALQLASWIALFHAALLPGVGARRLALCALTYAVAGLLFVVNLQFSSTAFLAAAAGGCLWLADARPDAAGGSGWRDASAVALLTLGALERFDPFLLAAGLFLGTALLLVGRALPRRAIAVMAAALALAFAARAYDAHAYRRDPEWRAFREFIPLLPQITDYGRASVYDDALAPAAAAVSWSANDHRLFMQWFHADPAVYSTEALSRLIRTAADAGPWSRLQAGARRLPRVLQNPALWPMLAALPLLLLGAGRRERTTAAALLCAAAVVSWYLAAFLKAAPQVYLPLWALAPFVALTGGRRAHAGGRALFAACAVLAVTAAGSAAVLQQREGRGERERSRTLRARIAPLVDAPGPVLIAWYNAFPFEVVRPLESTRGLRALRLYSLGWSQRTPAARAVLATSGRTDVIDALVGPNALLLAPESATGLLSLYAEEHRGLRVRFDAEDAPLGSFRGRLVRDPDPTR